MLSTELNVIMTRVSVHVWCLHSEAAADFPLLAFRMKAFPSKVALTAAHSLNCQGFASLNLKKAPKVQL